jgi:hypothetical protein
MTQINFTIKKLIICLVFQCCMLYNFGQSNLLNTFVKVAIPVYEPPFPELVKIELPTIYSEAAFDEALKGIDFSKIDILAWDLVFTRHPIGVNHNQLNENRLQWFYKRLPNAFVVPKHQTRIVEQTKAKTKEAAAKLFHGFAIYYRYKAKPEDVRDELKIIESVVTGIPIVPSEKVITKKPPKLTSPFNTGKLNKRQKAPFNVDEVEYTYTCNTAPVRKEMAAYYDSIEVVSLNELMNRSLLFSRNTYAHCDSVVIGYKYITAGKTVKITDLSIFDDTTTKTTTTKVNFQYIPDSTVLKVLNRNTWSSSVICADVTQSMTPYNTQLLLWIKNQTKVDSQSVFYFFNDGDSKKESQKVIGSIGGIYKIESNNFKQIAKTMHTAMRNGYGGDAPENNIECILQAQNDQPSAKEIIMLADNWASVKDMELLPQVKKPIRIILCGNRRLIQEDYLTIAYHTKGSVHTESKEINQLHLMKEGEIFEYNKTKYKLSKRTFVVMPYSN